MAQLLSGDQQVRFQQLRQKVAAGETLSLEEQKEALAMLRQGRQSVSEVKPKTRGTKAAAPAIDAQSLLSDLDKL